MTTTFSAVPRFPKGVYGLTPEWPELDRLGIAIEQAAMGGMRALQWRRKSLDAHSSRSQAMEINTLCRSLGVLFIVNDDWRLAATIGADGAHLGRNDGDLRQARQELGDSMILGKSCYNDLALAQQAIADGADYIAFGTVYPSSTKPDAVRATFEQIRQGRAIAEAAHHEGTRPGVVVIGGITANNAAPVVQAGADSLAMIQGLFDTPDTYQTALSCRQLFT